MACLLAIVLIGGCERPEIGAPLNGGPGVTSQSGVGLQFVNAFFRVDGILKSDRINLRTDRFAFLFVFIKSRGLYVVSTDQFENAFQSGQFTGARLIFIVDGTRIELETVQSSIFHDQVDRSAWVEHIPDYDLLGPDAKAGDAIVGLAARKNLIPGYAEYSR